MLIHTTPASTTTPSTTAANNYHHQKQTKSYYCTSAPLEQSPHLETFVDSLSLDLETLRPQCFAKSTAQALQDIGTSSSVSVDHHHYNSTINNDMSIQSISVPLFFSDVQEYGTVQLDPLNTVYPLDNATQTMLESNLNLIDQQTTQNSYHHNTDDGSWIWKELEAWKNSVGLGDAVAVADSEPPAGAKHCVTAVSNVAVDNPKPAFDHDPVTAAAAAAPGSALHQSQSSSSQQRSQDNNSQDDDNGSNKRKKSSWAAFTISRTGANNKRIDQHKRKKRRGLSYAKT